MSDRQWQIGEPLITLDEARELVLLLEASMDEDADNMVERLAERVRIYKGDSADDSKNEKQKDIQLSNGEKIFSEVGILTRGLHDSIRNFVEDSRLRVITDVEFPDASERLRYIINMTDAAATKTIDAVDACSPMADKLSNSIEELMPMWDRLMHGNIDRFEFVRLCHDIDSLLVQTRADVSILSSHLQKILLAQDYQDLTGQMIQKIIGLVGEVEDKLVSFLTNVSEYLPGANTAKVDKTAHAKQTAVEAQGPALARQKANAEAAATQDEVDDLLASLGF